MLLNSGMDQSNHTEDGHPWRWMKMACGENPITFGRSRGLTPESRLGEGFLFRKRMEEARQAKIKQDAWCYQAEQALSKSKDRPFDLISEQFPELIEQESLIALLRGRIKLNVHCYET